MNLIEELKKNPFCLAPMAGVTDCAFRSFMRELGCGIMITELVSASGLKFGSQKTRELMEYEDSQRPIGIQIFGETEETFAEAAKIVEDAGADFVDLNFGCPVKKVVKKGGGSAILKDLPRLSRVLSAVKSSVSIPVTIKIRTGWDSESRNANEVTHIAAEEGMTWVAVHGRTRAAGYSGFADWDYIKEIKERSTIPIIGNGDILSGDQALDRLKTSNCDGVMIGRGCLRDPWIFQKSLENFQKNPSSQKRDYVNLIERLFSIMDRHYTERSLVVQLRKFSAWYSHGYPESAAFRKTLFSTQEKGAVLSLSREYFGQWQDSQKKEAEPFLKSGHG